jgi:cytochrome c-type biogenesis protein CcmF
MRFKTEEIFNKTYYKHVGLAFGASLLVGFATAYAADLMTIPFVSLLITSFFVIFSNLDYIITVFRNNLKMVGSALSHIGFGILFLGAIFSGAKKQQISADSFMKVSAKGIEGFTEDDAAKNVLLYKGLPTQMSDYELTYKSDTIDGFSRIFTVHYKRFDSKDTSRTAKKVIEEFDLYPNVLYTIEKDKVAASNPSTKHYFYKDVFTHVVSLPIDKTDPMAAQHENDSLKYKQHELGEGGDTIFTSKNYITYKGLKPAEASSDYKPEPNDIAVVAELEIRNVEDNTVKKVAPRFVIRENMGIGSEEDVKELGLHIRFDKIDGYKKKIYLSIAESEPKRDFIVLSAIVFPGINLVWLGCSIMFLGIFMAMMAKIREKNA